jgi:hypothetical protein
MQNTMYSEKYEPEIFTEAVYNKMSKIHQMHIHKVSYVRMALLQPKLIKLLFV